MASHQQDNARRYGDMRPPPRAAPPRAERGNPGGPLQGLPGLRRSATPGRAVGVSSTPDVGAMSLPTGWSIIAGSLAWKPVGDKIVVDPPGRDTAPFVIPRLNSPERIGPGAGYHEYRAETFTPASDARTVGAIRGQLIRHPTLDPHAQPASVRGSRNDGGISPISGRYDDKVMSYLTKDIDGNTVVVNVTVPNEHLLNPGYVAQYQIADDKGARLVTAGAGNAWIQQGPGAKLGSTLFGWKNEGVQRRGIYDAARRR